MRENKLTREGCGCGMGTQAGMLADELLKHKADATRIIYNTFQSAMSFMPTMATVVSAEVAEMRAQEGGIMDAYEIEEEDRAPLLADLMEFQLASVLYVGLLENQASELGSRMSAMDSSTKNANEMLNKLTLTYNRSRQAAITTELIEIISGAAALEG
jgi:F-type H+-transporting ATPase subunit gamma